ncbi:hypothetical protein BDZ97DRAFT_741056 [Flammula alnicola]|nr:hypothetical protein BDZ97DRAFT_741056 [Flammula alnicola]
MYFLELARRSGTKAADIHALKIPEDAIRYSRVKRSSKISRFLSLLSWKTFSRSLAGFSRETDPEKRATMQLASTRFSWSLALLHLVRYSYFTIHAFYWTTAYQGRRSGWFFNHTVNAIGGFHMCTLVPSLPRTDSGSRDPRALSQTLTGWLVERLLAPGTQAHTRPTLFRASRSFSHIASGDLQRTMADDAVATVHG